MKRYILRLFSYIVNHHEKATLIVSYIFALLVVGLVYITGGTKNVYVNFMYIPIAITATISTRVHRTIFAILCGILVGPFMPLDVQQSIWQDPTNWMIRTIIFLVISMVIGFFSNVTYNDQKTIKKKDEEIHESQLATIFSLVKMTEVRDGDTGDHIERIVSYTELFLTKLKNESKFKKELSNINIECISRASALHDIGKTGIKDQILLKPGKLTEEEFNEIKKHTTIGAATLKEVSDLYPDNTFLNAGVDIILYHHEKWDGTGYPKGLRKTEIPLSARVVAIVDVYDALRSDRVYKKAISHSEAVDILEEGRNSHFDGKLLDVFITYQNDFNQIYLSNN